MSTQSVSPEILPPASQQDQSNQQDKTPSRKWYKGMPSPNPNGLNSLSISGHLNHLLKSGKGKSNNARRVAVKLLEHALEGRDSISVQSTGIILDRTEGKALNRSVELHVDENTMKRLCELTERLLGQ